MTFADRNALLTRKQLEETERGITNMREGVIFWLYRSRKPNVSKLEQQRKLPDSFVNPVTSFDDYVLLAFNYKDGETRLDFSDRIGSDLESAGGPNAKPLNQPVSR